jgi:CheY-like chemotaxis protein
MNRSAPVLEDTKRSLKASLLRLATEIRQDLHHVLGSLEVMLDEPPLSSKQSDSILRYYSCTDQLLRAANDLSELAESDSGTQIDFVFPIPGAPQEPLEHPGLVEGLRVLIAEDSDDSFALFQTFVKSEGHQVTRVLDGAQAVAMVKSRAFNILIMDVNMPVMDGYTATRKIRDWERELGRDSLPIVLLSADDGKTQLRLGAAVGCSSYLTKPTPKEELIRTLKYYAGGA